MELLLRVINNRRDYSMFRRFTKKRFVVALSVVAALAIAGAAIAYFSSSGSGTGNATVGSSSAFTINAGAATGTMYPGSGTSTFTYTVHNPSSGKQNLSSTSAAVAHDASGNIKDHGTAVAGCLAADFTAANTAPTPLPQNLAGGADSSAGSVDVTMTDSGSNQDACQGHTPDITVSAS
jgi:hypothetical protein